MCLFIASFVLLTLGVLIASFVLLTLGVLIASFVLLTLGAQRSKGYRSCLVCVCLSVCLSLCLSGHAILAVRAIKSIMKDYRVKHQICGNIKKVFSLKLSYSKVRTFSLTSAGAAILS